MNADYEVGGNISNSVSSYTNLVFRIYPEGTSSYNYYDDAASTTRTIQSTEAWSSHQVTVNMPALTTTGTLQVVATQPSSVTNNSTALTSYSTLAGLKAASQGWYWDPVLQMTLVKLPSSASARTIVLSGIDKSGYEAEFATRVNATTNTNHTGYTGTGFVDSFAASGSSVTFDVNSTAGSNHQLRFRYANATGGTTTRTIYVDGVSVGILSLPTLANWDTWGIATLSTSLTTGKHTIKIAYDAGNTGAINLDNLIVARP